MPAEYWGTGGKKMNRMAMMVLRNLFMAPPAYLKLHRYAQNPELYSDQEMWDHLHYMLSRAISRGQRR